MLMLVLIEEVFRGQKGCLAPAAAACGDFWRTLAVAHKLLGPVLAALAAACAMPSNAQQPPPAPGLDVAPPSKDAGTPAVVVDESHLESLLGEDVKSFTGDKLGRIVDLLVSGNGELRAAVIDFGGFLGLGSRKIAVSWSALKFSNRVPILNMTADELRIAPEFRIGEPVVIVEQKDRSPPRRTSKSQLE